MNIRQHLKSVLPVILAVLAVVLAAGYIKLSAARQERLLHDSQAIDALLSERDAAHH